MTQINCKGELICFDTPKVMGILNITPDSFYAQSRTTPAEVLRKAEQMLEEGATFVDIGGYSSRPNAQEVSPQEELQRVVPVVEALVKHFPDIRISVDTFRAEVARESLEAGACIINDISAGQIDPAIWEVVAHYQVPYIAMHMRGTPQTKQTYTEYDKLTKDILYYFSQIKDKARQLRINDLIVDPGFGFSKTLAQNYELMQQLALFKALECPILVGISRKSMIYKLLDTTPEAALNGTTVLNTFALLHGADILRVHDVKEAVECVKIVGELCRK
ncbi:dihydropteroate synthase [Capnocytophaga granulosa]|uniref:dihydropteroate synthase n=1 Tax=Capnocytophaga granulosa TaxID=45242 RepID=A0A1H2UZT6_9FLAO|nr:dihydropteroate synthase [Capnocytophaga granulosa]EPD28236.1 dihydropteroate synthase [Capnocytophaga granulosa ATCC 51502]SDW61595.1 dihydropteroate synthase [Capnocytophaga granulosa]SUX18181.1 Dihydropteroate synthase [Capnocytophaga granulosa]